MSPRVREMSPHLSKEVRVAGAEQWRGMSGGRETSR